MSQSKLKVELPDQERGIAPDVEKRFDKLFRRSLDDRLTKAQREAARDELAKMERNVAERGDHAWREGVTAETTLLALARGEEVAKRSSGALRIITRDGLESLMQRHHLTAEERDDGMAFREGWEARSPLGSSTADQSAGGTYDNDRAVLNGLQRAKALQRLGRIERAVALECRDEPVCLQMLREIAGNAKAITVFGEGRAFARNVAALKRALGVTATILRG